MEPITIGVNTRNRPEALAVQIHSIIHQTYPFWSLIIMDCSDIPVIQLEPIQKLLELAKKLGHSVQVIRHKSTFGIPQTYQKLMEISNTELNVREEDDAPWHPELLIRLYEEMVKNPNLGAAGPTCPNWNDAGAVHNTWPGTNYFYITDNHAWRQQLGPVLIADDVQRRPWPSVEPIPVCVMHGGFMYRKSLMVKAGGFCTNLSTQGHREETWASLRLFLSGADILFVPRAIRWHLELQSGGSRDRSVDNDRMALKMRDERLFQDWMRGVLGSGNSRISEIPIFADESLRERISAQQALELLTECKVG